jgi:hypothetical protein
MKIYFVHDSVNMDTKTLHTWFPHLSHRHWIDGNDLVDELNDHFHDRYGIKKHDVKETLLELLAQLGSHSSIVGDQTQMRVARVLRNHLATGVRTAWDAKGLRVLRHTFIILAYLAFDHESFPLAEVLSQFWLTNAHLISQKESPKYEGDWHKAFEKIRELMEGPARMDPGALAMIPYVGLHRGRSPRALALPWSGHRSRSLPAIRRRHNPDMRLATPTYSNSAWPSPMISPVGYPRDDYFEELNNLQYQQSEMSMKLDNVDGKLDILLAGYYY